jgi:hypothetical protein
MATTTIGRDGLRAKNERRAEPLASSAPLWQGSVPINGAAKSVASILVLLR